MRKNDRKYWKAGHQARGGKLMTIEDAEKYLLSRLDDPNGDEQTVRRELVLIYRSMGRAADAMLYAEVYLTNETDPEKRSEIIFFLGQAMERIHDIESAIRLYT